MPEVSAQVHPEGRSERGSVSAVLGGQMSRANPARKHPGASLLITPRGVTWRAVEDGQ